MDARRDYSSALQRGYGQPRGDSSSNYDTTHYANAQFLMFRLRNHQKSSLRLLNELIGLRERRAYELRDDLDPTSARSGPSTSSVGPVSSIQQDSLESKATCEILQRDLNICRETLKTTDLLFNGLNQSQVTVLTLMVCITGIMPFVVPRNWGSRSSQTIPTLLWVPFTASMLTAAIRYLGVPRYIVRRCITNVAELQMHIRKDELKRDHGKLLGGMAWFLTFRLLSIEFSVWRDLTQLGDLLTDLKDQFLGLAR